MGRRMARLSDRQRYVIERYGWLQTLFQLGQFFERVTL